MSRIQSTTAHTLDETSTFADTSPPIPFSLRERELIWLKRSLGGLGLLALAFVCYAPMMPGSFLMDDLRLVEWDNPLVTGAMRPHEIWFQTDFPLSTFTLRLEWLAWGKNPAGYHIVNVLLHATSAILLWRLLTRLRIPGAWLAAALFVVHPVCVNSVARIAEIKNTLSLPFFLLSFWLYLRHEEYWLNPPTQRAHPRAAAWCALALIAFVLALLGKTSTVMLPVLLLGCAAWQRGRISRTDFWHTMPFFILSLGFGLMTVWFQKHQALAGQTLDPVSAPERLLGAVHGFWFYLGKALVPQNLNLAYAHWDVNPSNWAAYVPLLLLCAAVILCCRFRRSWGRHVLFGLGCFAVTLLPALGFVGAQFQKTFQVSDHLQYLPLIAPVALVTAAAASVFRANMLRLVGVPFLALFLVACYQRATVFSSSDSLLRDTLQKNPAAWSAANDLGCIYAEKKSYATAAGLFATSLQSNPNNADAHANLGQALALQKNLADAESHFRAALHANPNHFVAHHHLAEVLAAQDRNREALIHYRAAIHIKHEADTHAAFGALCFKIGEHREAVIHLRHAVQLKPESAETRNNLAWLLATCPEDSLRDGPAAVRYAEQACQLTGYAQPPMVGTLAAAYAEAGRFAEAISTCEQTVQLAEQSGARQFAAVNRQLLRLYRANKPYHTPPMRQDSSTPPNPKSNQNL